MITKALVSAIKAYQFLSRGSAMKNCRFHPSCSQYAIDALQAHGVGKGLIKALWRIARCSPLSDGGHDPVR